MGLYEEIRRDSLIEPILPELKKMIYVWDKTGEHIIPGPFQNIKYDVPWIWVGHDPSRICRVWLEIYFKKYGFVSRNCFNCYKIVVRLNHFEDLIKLHAMQIALKKSDDRFNGKCGMELRPFAQWKGRYAGFWYTPMIGDKVLEVAKEMTTIVKKWVKDQVNKDLEVILKRGCTEMEEKFGSSEKWKYEDAFNPFEDQLDELIQIPPNDPDQPKQLKNIILGQWMEHAFVTGDPTIKKFCDKFPESFGITPTTNYYGLPASKIVNPNVRRGKINARDEKGKDKFFWPDNFGKELDQREKQSELFTF